MTVAAPSRHPGVGKVIGLGGWMTRFSGKRERAEARFYSVREAAQLLGVSPMTVYRAIADGELLAVRIRKRLIIPAHAIDELVEPAARPSAEAAFQEVTGKIKSD